MDDKVHQVVAENIELSKIIVQGKGKIGENANALFIGIFDQPLNPVPCKNLDLDIRILGDVAPIIKMERDRKGIRVSQEGYSGDEPNRDQMTKRKRPISFPR